MRAPTASVQSRGRSARRAAPVAAGENVRAGPRVSGHRLSLTVVRQPGCPDPLTVFLLPKSKSPTEKDWYRNELCPFGRGERALRQNKLRLPGLWPPSACHKICSIGRRDLI